MGFLLQCTLTRVYKKTLWNSLAFMFKSILRWAGVMVYRHKVLTYIECRAVSGVFRTIDPPPSPPSECVLPPHQRRGGGYTLGRGVNISEDPRHWIGLLQYNPSTCTGVGEVEGHDGQLCSHLSRLRQGDQGRTTVLPTLFVISRPVWQKNSATGKKVQMRYFARMHHIFLYQQYFGLNLCRKRLWKIT